MIDLEIELLQVALGCRKELSCIPSDKEWLAIMSFAERQGLLGFLFGGVECLPKHKLPNMDMLMDWLGQVEYQKTQYEQNWTVAKKLDKLWQEAGISAVVLKGRSIAQYYEKPELRYSCDLDIFIPSPQWQKACELLERKGIVLEYEVYKEAEFTVDGVYVECHKVITPIRGNKTLLACERYLRKIITEEQRYFDSTHLVNPPIDFIAMLWVEHALGDLLHDKMQLKHIVDWVILRKQICDRDLLNEKSNEFGFYRFLKMADSLADFIEEKISYNELHKDYQNVFNSIISPKATISRNKSWFLQRVDVLKGIIKSEKMFRKFGYCSMTSFLWNAVWSHFFEKDLKTE